MAAKYKAVPDIRAKITAAQPPDRWLTVSGDVAYLDQVIGGFARGTVHRYAGTSVGTWTRDGLSVIVGIPDLAGPEDELVQRPQPGYALSYQMPNLGVPPHGFPAGWIQYDGLPPKVACAAHDPIDTGGMRVSWCRSCDAKLHFIDTEWREATS